MPLLIRRFIQPIPPGDPNYNKDFWQLKKALYELKQSGRQ